jgi:hypothetical protein
VLSENWPEEADVGYDHVLAGESLKFIKDKLMSLPPAERLQKTEDVLRSIKENAGVTDSNDLLALAAITQTFSVELGLSDPDDFDWDRLIENVVGIADATVIASLAGKLLKAAKLATMGKTMGLIERTNPQRASALHLANIEEQGVALSDAVGLSPVESYLRIMPGSKADFGTIPPDSVIKNLEIIRKSGEELIQDTTFGINFTEAEKVAGQQQIVKVLGEETGGGVRLSRSTFTPDTEGVSADVVVGLSDELPFKTIADAKDAAMVAFGKDTKPTLLWEDPKTGLLQDVPTWVDDVTLGDFYYKTQARYDYNAAMFNDMDNLTFGGEAFHHSSFLPNSLRDINAKFGSLLRRTIIRAEDFGKGIEGRLLEMAAPFSHLSDSSKVRVSKWMDEGSRDERVLSYYDLVGKGASSDEIEAYYAQRILFDTEWSLNNIRMRSHLGSQGHKHVYNTQSGWEAFGKPISRPTGRTQAFNPTTNQIETLSEADLIKLYQEGDTLVSLATTERVGKTATNVAIMKNTENTKVAALPRDVLAYRQGYVTRIYEDNYFVLRHDELTVNGKATPKTSAVYSAPTKADAQRLAAKLSKENPEAKYSAALDRGLQDRGVSAELSFLNNTGGLITGKRGDHLKALDDTKAIISDPVESMVRSIKITSRKVSHDDAVTTLKQRMVNEYKDVLPVKDGRTYLPDDLKEITSGVASDKRVTEAREILNSIKSLEGAKNPTADWWRGAVTKTSEFLSDAGWEKTSKVVLDNGLKKDPFQFARGITFNTLLGLNPARQLILQSNQATFLFGATGVNPLRLAPDSAALLQGLAFQRTPALWKSWKSKGAKMMGVKPDEYEMIVNHYRKSGIPFAIDSHTFGRDGLVQWSQKVATTPSAKALKFAGNALKAPIKFSRQIGFDMGELNNLTASYAAAFRRWQKLNPKKDWRTTTSMDEIGVQARELALNMTKSGEFFYQEGWLSLATQFHSFQHKALLAVLPKKLGGSQILSRAEKVKVLAAQMTMYGLDGVGLTAAYDKARDSFGWEIPEEAEPFLNGIVYDYAFNKVLQDLGGDDSSLSVTKSIAPGSGNVDHITDLVVNAMNMSSFELFLGATQSVVNRGLDVFSNVGFILKRDGLETPEKVKAALKEFSTLSSGMNNYWKAQAAIQLGHAVNKVGDPVLTQTYNESFANIFGITSDELDAYYKTSTALYGKPGSKQREDALKDIAKEYYAKQNRAIGYLLDDAPATLDDVFYRRIEEAVATEAMILDALPEQDAERVLMHFRSLVNSNLKLGKDELTERITQWSLRNKSVDETTYLMNVMESQLLGNGVISQKEFDDTKSYIEYMIGKEE